MAQFTIRIYDELNESIAAAAEADKRSKNSEIEWLLERGLQARAADIAQATKRDIWVLEFSGSSHGQAQDVVRQHTPAGTMVPDVQDQGRCGYELVSTDYDLIDAVRCHVVAGGGEAIVSKR